MSDTETDPLDDVVARLTALQAEERSHSIDLQRWWSILVNSWSDDLRREGMMVNQKLQPFNFHIAEVSSNTKSGIETRVTVSAYGHHSFHEQARAYPPLVFALTHSGAVNIECGPPANPLLSESLLIEDPKSRASLRGVLARYAEAVIKQQFAR